MKFQTILLSVTATLASCAIGLVAQAEIVNSRCDIYPRGDDRASKVVNCTFYQRQGNITIERADGVTYELTLKGDKYVDQNGQPVTQEQDGPAIIFRLAKESVYVYQGERAPSSTAKSKSDTFKTVCGVNSWDCNGDRRSE